MALRSTVSQPLWWPLLSAATLLFLLGEALGGDWDEQLGGAAYPAVEYVAEKPSTTYKIPLELNEEPFFLVEWTSEASRERRGHRFILPPGILLVASIVTAALLLSRNARHSASLTFWKKYSSHAAGAEVAAEVEDSDAVIESEYGTSVDSSSDLQSVLKAFSETYADAIDETRQKKNSAVELLNDYAFSGSVPPEAAEIISYLLDATDKLVTPAQGVANAMDVLQLPLSDSQAIFRLNSALEDLQAGIQGPLNDSYLMAELQAAHLYLGPGEGPASEHTHLKPDDQPAALRRATSLLGPSGVGEPKGTEQRILLKLSEWLECLDLQQRLLSQAAPVVTKAVADVRAVYDLP
ncbi:hypothetical protein, conserved [Eimeria brunetti]|uniref:Uncharacterized protein n=1 Tax=Eimeria brunetti TaxID=51314 RepID=U6M1B4_9EIME|nr:hypothetical protein, conserved [Eimeria brunetti]